MELLGNNSHALIDRDGYRSLQMGNLEEPFCLHVHIINRGDPEYAYLAGVSIIVLTVTLALVTLAWCRRCR